MTWNDAKPAVTNSIAADIPDIEENFQELLWASLNRSQFTYNGGATAYTVKAKAALYSCKDKFCYWTTELTTAAVGAPAASDWYYLYLDYSGITSGTAITNSELAWSTTAPTFDTTYRGWYNGDDRCIFAAMTNATPNNFIEFIHSGGDLVVFADRYTSRADAALTDTWTAVTLTMPAFSRQAPVSFVADPNEGTAVADLHWRTYGQTASTGHVIVRASAGFYDGNTHGYSIVVTDSSQRIDIRFNVYDAGKHAATVFTDGWYFPIGM